MDATPPPTLPSPRRVPIPVLIGIAVALLAIAAIAAEGGKRSPSRHAVLSVADLTSSPPAPGAPTEPEDHWIEWKADDGPRRLLFADFTVDLAAVDQEGLGAAKVTARSPGGEAVELIGDGLPWGAAAKIAVVRLSASTGPTLLVSTFSGGAHCCTSLTALERHGGGWRRTDLGQWDGDTPALPADLDGDGVKEFQFVDQTFLYAFAPYADSWAPPVVQRLVGGHVRDVSADVAFRPLYTRAAEDSRQACLDRSNGACAAFVAASARAGRLDAAWAQMLSTYDQASDWILPTACRVRAAGSCPDGAELTFATYPEALQWFLGEQGYAARAYVEPMAAAGPSFACGSAGGTAERLVCRDEKLARLDRTLAVAFTRALALTADRPALRAGQREFLSERNALAAPADLAALYERRIEQLLAVDERT